MSVNKYLPHILVLPEDDADQSLANGFVLNAAIDPRRIQVLPEAGGWLKVQDSFKSDHVAEMQRYPNRFMVLLLDFDQQSDRRVEIERDIPPTLANRVFVIGAWSEPEKLTKAGLGSLETIGGQLANECLDKTWETWNHQLLKHNEVERKRMSLVLRPILFSPD